MSRCEDEVLFGGSAGGGKSDALVMEALRQVNIPQYKGLLMRKTYAQTVSQQVQADELSKLSDKIPELYSIAYNRYRDENDADLDRLYALLDVDSEQFEKYLDSENLKLDKAQLAYKMQDKSNNTKSQSQKAENDKSAENTSEISSQPSDTPTAEDTKAQSVKNSHSFIKNTPIISMMTTTDVTSSRR